MSRHPSLASLLLVGALVACTDEPSATNAQAEPTAPTALEATSNSTAGDRPLSSVCKVYLAKQDEAKAILAERPGDIGAQELLEAYEARFVDACQQ